MHVLCCHLNYSWPVPNSRLIVSRTEEACLAKVVLVAEKKSTGKVVRDRQIVNG